MLVQLTEISPLVLAPVLIGVLTLFGKKKKEEKPGESKAQPGTSSDVGYTGMGIGTAAGSEAEDSSLNKILRSLMQDIPASSENDQISGAPLATPEWVPPRATPPSRPMVIVPGEKGEKGKRVVEEVEVVPGKAGQKATEPEAQHARPTVEPEGFSPFPKLAGLDEEMKRLEEEVKRRLEAPEKAVKPPKPERTEVSSKDQKQEKREPEKKEPEKRTGGKPKSSFEHVFELTKGVLKSPGLVLVSGPEGSGKTAFCSGLTASYLQQGSPCLMVSYDRSPNDVREALKKMSCDVSGFESQFRFLLVDGFSTQTEAFSMEPYSVERPFDLASLTDTIMRNVQVFMGERVAVVLDSLDGFLSRISVKELVKGLRETVEKLKESGAVFVVTLDSKKLTKELEDPLNETASCWIELEKEGGNGGRFRVRKLEGSSVKADAEMFEFDAAKGLVFV